MSELYDRDYFENGLATGKSLYDNYRWMPERSCSEAMALIDAFSLKRGDAVLDFGCGKGFMVRAFRILHREAFGVDISRYAVCTADPSVRQYLRLNTHGFPFKREFKLVVAKDVFEHLDNATLHQTLEELKGKCEHLFVAVPLGNGKTYNVAEMNYDATHRLAYPIEYWGGIFESSGYKVVSAETEFHGMKENWSHLKDANGFFTLSPKK